MAMAAAAHKLNVPLSLFVPTSTPQIIHENGVGWPVDRVPIVCLVACLLA